MLFLNTTKVLSKLNGNNTHSIFDVKLCIGNKFTNAKKNLTF